MAESGGIVMRYGSPGPRRVLVAEDDQVVRTWLTRTLETQDIEVLAAENGREAVEMLRRRSVDLVITDLWMPLMNGVELIETMDRMGWATRSDRRLPEIVVLSAHLTGASTEKLRGLGVFRTLTKPIATDEVIEVVRQGLASDRRARLAAARARAQGDATAERPLVLVADDDEGVRGVLKRVLTEAGYEVVEACDGEEAVEKALANDIDLVIMDINMPRMNGHQAVGALKRVARDCFVICMSGECNRAELERTRLEGAMSCFPKPFDIDEVLVEVHRLDLIASHRRRLAERERMRAEAEKGGSLAERARGWVNAQEYRFGRRFKILLACAAAIVIGTGVAVPLISSWTRAAADAARTAAEKMGRAADAAGRVEGYLQRDEARELERTGR